MRAGGPAGCPAHPSPPALSAAFDICHRWFPTAPGPARADPREGEAPEWGVRTASQTAARHQSWDSRGHAGTDAVLTPLLRTVLAGLSSQVPRGRRPPRARLGKGVWPRALRTKVQNKATSREERTKELHVTGVSENTMPSGQWGTAPSTQVQRAGGLKGVRAAGSSPDAQGGQARLTGHVGLHRVPQEPGTLTDHLEQWTGRSPVSTCIYQSHRGPLGEQKPFAPYHSP